jgi:hypothetical protein
MVPVLLASLMSAVASPPDNSSICPAGFVVVQEVGMTKGGHYFAGPSSSAAACCARCAQDASKCNAWTYHPTDKATACALATTASERVGLGQGNVAGYRVGHGPGTKPPPTPDPEAPCAATPPSPKAAKGSPNIVLFLMDDMDIKLGSWAALKKTTELLTSEGMTAENWMIHTPVCCPSRSELVRTSLNVVTAVSVHVGLSWPAGCYPLNPLRVP